MDLDDIPMQDADPVEPAADVGLPTNPLDAAAEEEEEIGLPAQACQSDIRRNPDLIHAVNGLQRKTDHTEDKIDWKRCYEEDLKAAKELAQDQKWDESLFVTGNHERDTEWCFACRWKPKSTDGNGVKRALNEFISKSYGSKAMLALLDGVQEIYTNKLLRRMRSQNKEVKFWFRRAIYDHIHLHNATGYVNAHVDKQRSKIMRDELWAARNVIDASTGASTPNFRAIPMMLKLSDRYDSLTTKIENMQRNGGIWESF